MKITKSKIKSLEDLFIMKIKYLYDIEAEIVKALPKVIKKTTNAELQNDLKDHLIETEEHVKRLEQIFDMLEVEPKKMKSATIRGLVADAEMVMAEEPAAEIMDAAIVASCRSIEHFEMSEYLSAIAWAESLGHDEAIKLLEATLTEERDADMKLNEGNDAIVANALEAVMEEEDK